MYTYSNQSINEMTLQEHKAVCGANLNLFDSNDGIGIAYDDELKTIRCPRCNEEIIERFAEDHTSTCAPEM